MRKPPPKALFQPLSPIQTRKERGERSFLENWNPLHSLSLRRAQQIYDSARAGGYCLLQYLYSEIEKADPTLLTAIERRSAGVLELGWSTHLADGVDETNEVLANEQLSALTEFFSGIENLDEAIEHFDSAFFRGYAHAAFDGTRFDLLQSYNFCYSKALERWLWAKDGSYNCCAGELDPGSQGLTVLPPDALVSVTHEKAIDYPALEIFLRTRLAERDWGRFVERYGLPPVYLIEPEAVTAETQESFRRAAEAMADAASLSLPYGTQVNFAESARGVNPFRDFVKHQQELTLILATGGSLLSLAEAGSGTLAGNGQLTEWERLLRRDGRIIGSALNAQLAQRYLKAVFPGQPVLAYFRLGSDAQPTPKEMFELGAAAKAAGFTIDRDEMQSATGYTLEELSESAPANPFANRSQRLFNSAARTAQSPFVRAVQSDLKGLGDLLYSKLDNLGAVSSEELEDALPKKPEAAQVLEEELAQEVAQALTNSDNPCRAKDPASCPVHGSPRARESETRKESDNFGTTNQDKLIHDSTARKDRFEGVMSAALKHPDKFYPKAYFRKDTGWIGFSYGKEGNANNEYKGGFGLAHIQAKHPGAIENLFEVLEGGKAYKSAKSPNKLLIIKDDACVVLTKKRTGRMLITDYNHLKKEEIEKRKVAGAYHVKGEN